MPLIDNKRTIHLHKENKIKEPLKFESLVYLESAEGQIRYNKDLSPYYQGEITFRSSAVGNDPEFDISVNVSDMNDKKVVDKLWDKTNGYRGTMYSRFKVTIEEYDPVDSKIIH